LIALVHCVAELHNDVWSSVVRSRAEERSSLEGPSLAVQMLGGFRLLYCGEPVADWHMPRLQSLLAYLILHRGISQSRAHLASTFWPESAEAQARTNLRGLVLAMRRALPEADRCLCGDASSLWWCEHAPCVVDVEEFGRTAQASSMVGLRRAVELYRGDLLPGCYDEWVLPERDRLRQLYLDALERLVTELEACGDKQSAIAYARRMMSADPLREETYRLLMRLYAAVGDRAQAVRTYQECTTVFQRELAVDPDPATRAVYSSLLVASVPPAGDAATATVSTNLPRHLSSFVGR
jgi:DNA-binding SARP family transcriptional activator